MAVGRSIGGPMMGGRPPMPPRGKRREREIDMCPPLTNGQKSITADDFYEEDFDMEQMEKECEEMLNVHYLNKDNCTFSQTDGDFINLHYNDILYENIDIIRTFPFTEPYSFLSVREASGKKREIGIIEHLNNDFDTNTIKVICKQLDIRYFMPAIQKINSIKEMAGYIHFKVTTNHGELNFSLQSNGNHFTYLSSNRILITDLEGNRYEIPDTNELTTKELKKLDLYL